MIFKENGASVGNPSVPWGWVFTDAKVVFRVGHPPKTGSVSRPDRQPSAPIGPARPPSAACGWESSVGTGLPLQTPPDFLFVIYKVDVVGVVYCSHTPEESADKSLQKSFKQPYQFYKHIRQLYELILFNTN